MAPTDTSPRVLVVGGGVIGLVSAWVLLDRGFHVTIVAKEWASFAAGPRLTSQIAGALWEFPPAVCGHHTAAASLASSKRWSMVAYRVWDAIAADPALAAAAGVRMRESAFFFPARLEELPEQLAKLRELERSGVRGVRRDSGLQRRRGLAAAAGAVDAYRLLAPVIDTDCCMAWLMEMVRSKGATLVTHTITGDLRAQEDTLLERFDADAIVNAAGLGSSDLVGDAACYPLRGALLRVVNDSTAFPKITTAMAVSADVARSPDEIVFIVPRNDDILLLGGIAQPGRWHLDLTPDSPEVARMRHRCEAFLPCLAAAKLDPAYPLAQGLRPARAGNVRVEREPQPSRIVHAYGHGGSGWSLAFGCAEEVASLIEDILHDHTAGLTAADGRGGGVEIQSRL